MARAIVSYGRITSIRLNYDTFLLFTLVGLCRIAFSLHNIFQLTSLFVPKVNQIFRFLRNGPPNPTGGEYIGVVCLGGGVGHGPRISDEKRNSDV